jgi:acyl-CoA thioesterase-2
MTLLDTALLSYQRSVFDRDIMAASLDHALWFHRPFRADEWLLYSIDSPSAQHGRGLARGLVYDRDGHLVASTAQEGMIRVAPGDAADAKTP